MSASQLSSQHLIVDDAAVSDQHVFEAWGGTEESWIQPSLAVAQGWNVSPGIIFNSSTNDFSATNWLIENKVVPRSWTKNRWGVGNVSAVVFDFNGNLTQLYSFIPISRMIFNSQSFLHLNLGLEANHLQNDWEYLFTSGIRADIAISDRILVLSEFYSFNFSSSGFQAGFRFIIIPGHLETDITYGRGFDNIMTYPGFNVGISIIPY